jgi:hypothetical protein
MAGLTTNDKGAIAEAEIAAAATQLGYVVLKPMSERRRYDLVLDTGPRLLRVQCKWASLNGEVVVLRARTSRYTPNGYVRTTYGPTEIDAFGIYCAALDRCFLVPIADLEPEQGMLHLRLVPAKNGQHVGVKLAAQYDFGAVAQMARATGWQPVGREFESLQLHSPPPSSEPNSGGLVRADDLRLGLGAYLQRPRQGESFTITRRGHHVAQLIPPEPGP